MKIKSWSIIAMLLFVHCILFTISSCEKEVSSATITKSALNGVWYLKYYGTSDFYDNQSSARACTWGERFEFQLGHGQLYWENRNHGSDDDRYDVTLSGSSIKCKNVALKSDVITFIVKKHSNSELYLKGSDGYYRLFKK